MDLNNRRRSKKTEAWTATKSKGGSLAVGTFKEVVPPHHTHTPGGGGGGKGGGGKLGEKRGGERRKSRGFWRWELGLERGV